MRRARVIGTLVATVKDPGLLGQRILLIQPLSARGECAGPALAALDQAGVGPGEEVFYVTAKEASLPFLPEQVPTDACVLGVVDRVTIPPDPA